MARLTIELAIPNKPSSAREDYLKAVFALGGADRLVHTTALAAALKISKPSVSAMVKRLADEGLAEYSPRQGVRLTDAGYRSTMRVVRRHRLLETFFVQVLGLDWAEVHEDAEVLEHHLSRRIVDAIDRVLDHPSEDPHGRPIPDADGKLRERDLFPLGDLARGENGRVREMRAERADNLRRWKELGLVPGARFRMEDKQESEDVMHIRIGNRVIVTGSEGVEGIYVERSS